MSKTKVLSRELLAELRDAGFVLVRSKRHLIFNHVASGQVLTISATPKDKARALANIHADLKRLARQRGQQV